MARIYTGLEVIPQIASPPAGVSFQLEVSSLILNGQFYRNDALTPASQYDDGLVELRSDRDTASFGNTHDQSYSVRLVKPKEKTIYPLFYGSQTPGALMPINTDAPIGCFLYETSPF
jgi:hypothetical protein